MHIYEKDGNKYPSVTTITHSLGNDDLMRWSNFLGFRHIKYDDEMERTSTFGTLVHSHLQSIVDPDSCKPLIPSSPIIQYDLDIVMDKFKTFISKYDYKTVFTEKTIISDELKYAGTLDWLTNIGNKLVLIDFKTSKAPRFPMYLQLGGYNNLLKTIGYEPEYAGILTANLSGCKLHPIDKETIDFFSGLFNDLAVYFIKSFNVEVPINYTISDSLTSN